MIQITVHDAYLLGVRPAFSAMCWSDMDWRPCWVTVDVGNIDAALQGLGTGVGSGPTGSSSFIDVLLLGTVEDVLLDPTLLDCGERDSDETPAFRFS